MTNDLEPTLGRNLWQALAAQWFTPLPSGQELRLLSRLGVCCLGTGTFLVLYRLFESPAVFQRPDLGIWGIILYYLIPTVVLGFLLAWKREGAGPVRLYISGVTVPAFVLFVVRLATLLPAGDI